MSFDGMVTFAMTKELNEALRLGKIEKIYQPQPEQLLFNIHTKQGGKKLLVSVSGSHSAVYLVDRSPDNPASPPPFCMVLRKHLGAGRITDIKQYENDRIIEILIETADELGFSLNRKLIIEIMGKHSNAVLVDMKDNKIIDSIKHISIDVNRARQILPGKTYEYPPTQHKTPFTETSRNDFARIFSESSQPSRALLSEVQGLSPALSETIAEAGCTQGSSDSDADKSYDALRRIIDSVRSKNCTPIVYTNEHGKPEDFHITPLYRCQGAFDVIHFDTVSEAAGYYFSHRESSNILKQQSSNLLRTVNASLDKLLLKSQKLKEDLLNAENSEKYRIYGELITANIQNIRPGASNAILTNYYDGSEMNIPLDPRFSPSKNAQIYYKKYGKSKTALKEKKIQLEEVSRETEYLESVSEFIKMASSSEELEAIKQELTDGGFIKYRNTKKHPAKSSKPKPFSYESSSGKKILVGRNNKENDWLTLKKASNSDIWLHTKDIPGSHVILFTEGEEPSESDLTEAASIAAFHSKAKDSENVPVDYTKARYVKKPSKARFGMVIFTHNKTLYVNPKIPDSNEKKK